MLKYFPSIVVSPVLSLHDVLRLLIERLIAFGDGDGFVEPDGDQFRRSDLVSDAVLLQDTVHAADIRDRNAPIVTQCFACFVEGFDEKRRVLSGVTYETIQIGFGPALGSTAA